MTYALPMLAASAQGNHGFTVPVSPWAPSASKIFQLRKHTRSLYPLCYRKHDPLVGYVGHISANDKARHNTFPRFAPSKLYAKGRDILVPLAQRQDAHKRSQNKPRKHRASRQLPAVVTSNANRRVAHQRPRKMLETLRPLPLKFRNPFKMNDPTPETVFLVTRMRR